MLDALLAELGKAAAHASRICAAYSRQRLLDSCTEHEDGTLSPNIDRITLGDVVVDVHEYSLSRPGALDIHELKVGFEVEVDPNISGLTNTDGDSGGLKVRLKKGLMERNSHMKVEAVFKRGPSPEASNLLTDLMNDGLRESADR